MRYTIELDWTRFRRILRNMQRNMRTRMREKLLRVAERAAELARSNAPVRTGELQMSIGVQHERIGGTALMIAFVADTHYAVMQEKGFWHVGAKRKIPGRFFMKNAITVYEPYFTRAMGEAALESVKHA